MSYEVLARKYRPINFQEVIGQDHIVKALVNSIDQEKIHQAFIFSGTRGIGKTTIARILAKCLNCDSSPKPTSNPCNKCSNTKEISAGRSVDFLEIDAASNTQVEKIRDLIETVEYMPAKGRFKIYLIDEVHMLSSASFNALLKTLEEPPSHVIFIFATTNPEKIPKTVQSRCLQLNLKTVDEEILVNHLKDILEKEEIKYDNESISLIASAANGSVRDGLTLLDQAIAYGNGELLKEDVKALLGTIDNSLLIELIDSVIDGNGKSVFDLLSKIEELKPEYDNILKDIISVLHQISLHQIIKNSDSEDIRSLSIKTDKEFCQLLYEIAINAYSKFSVHPNPKEALEICLLRMLTFNPLQKLNEGNNQKKEDIPEKKNFKKLELEITKSQNTKVEQDNDILKSNEDWLSFFNKVELSPFARNYFGNMSFKSYKDSKLTLIKDDQAGEIPENIILEFKSVIKNSFKIEVELLFEVGNASNSPLSLKDIEDQKDLDNAQKSLHEDQDIKEFIKKYNGRIKTDTVKPIK
jgi:DNA polymerase-3 subunit gamma/tau